MTENYQTPREWYKNNRSQLKKYRGQWIAYTKNGVIAHHPKYLDMKQNIDENITEEYVIERIYETEFMEPVKFYPIRFRTLKTHDWQPKYEVILKFLAREKINILVDSGADMSVISKQLGQNLGYEKSPEEIVIKGEGVGGSVDYILRNIEIEIDGHKFNAPVAWVQKDDFEEIILGREIVFDLFDIEFKQADEIIIFKFRGGGA
ncbi:MAG TPA: aspartyl protease family protein [Allocoleopsis sp.]